VPRICGLALPPTRRSGNYERGRGTTIERRSKSYGDFNNIRVRSFILKGAPYAYKTANVSATSQAPKQHSGAFYPSRLAQIDESIARYLSQLESADRQGEAVPEAKITRLNEKIATLRQEYCA
jgi:hypothetical protein